MFWQSFTGGVGKDLEMSWEKEVCNSAVYKRSVLGREDSGKTRDDRVTCKAHDPELVRVWVVIWNIIIHLPKQGRLRYSAIIIILWHGVGV